MTDSIPVLLHAAARGARLQCMYDSRGWQSTSSMPRGLRGIEYRIHPDDAHLRYGPISSVLYEAAKEPSQFFYFGNGAVFALVGENCRQLTNLQDEVDYMDCNNKLIRSLFLLFVAESLLEQGL